MKGVSARSPLRPVTIAFQIALAIGLVLGGSPAVVLAQGYIPPDRGLPGRREGGGTRGDCGLVSNRSLVALMPESNFSVTVSERPTLYWYLPQTTAARAEFQLLKEDGTEIYTYGFSLNGQAGISSVTLPPEMPALEVGKTYRWNLALICDPDDLSGNILTEGWLRRQAASEGLARQLAAASEGDRFRIYRDAGIWQNALMELASQRRTQPSSPSLSTRWADLLNTVGLRTLADAPIIPCCEPIRSSAAID